MLWLPAFGNAKAVQATAHAPDNFFALKQSTAVSPACYDQLVVTQCAFDPPIVGGADWLGVSGEFAWVAAAKRK